MNRTLRIFGYRKQHLNAKIHFDPQQINIEGIDFIYDDKWQDMYPDTKEVIGEKILEVKTAEVKTTACKDKSHAMELVTRRSIIWIVIFWQSTLVKNYSKRQNTVES